MNDVMPAGMAYAYTLLNSWEEIRIIREKYRETFLSNQLDPGLQNLYISKLTSFWLELYPKIKCRTDENFPELALEFETFQGAYENPRTLKEITKLELLLRRAIEALKITDFEGGR